MKAKKGKNMTAKDSRPEISGQITKSAEDEPFVIGIGASAGGLEALQEFLGNLNFGALQLHVAIIIAQHLSPSYKSMLVQLLSRSTKMEVVEVFNGASVTGGKVYITPPDSEITIKNNTLFLRKPSMAAGPKPSIDIFLSSLAQDKKEVSIGVILSGTGSDGSQGIREIKAAGGFTIAQEPQTAKYDGMPLSAIYTEKIDLVLSPDKMGEEIRDFIINPRVAISEEKDSADSGSMNKLFNLLSKRTQTDFSNYKASTICRRLEKRLASLKINNVEQYLKYVDSNPRELDQLFQMILIGVTQFFRDTEAFNELEKYLRQIIERKTIKDPIRIWVPGCATGEEPYSIAILFHNLLGKRAGQFNIQIFATDIDEKAISFARKGLYPKSSISELPSFIVEKHFTKRPNDQYEVNKEIKQLVLFSKHDVTVNPPFLKLDLISCRNLLIYFNLALQKHVIPVFHYSLNFDGILFLGKSETVGQFADLFSTLDGKYKIFKRRGGVSMHALKFASFKPQRKISGGLPGHVGESSRMTINEMVKETFYNTFEFPYVVINDTMDIQEVYGDVRMYLSLAEGTMNTNLLKYIIKDLQIELRSLAAKAIDERVIRKGKVKKIKFFGMEQHVRLVIKPLLYSKPDTDLYVVIFEKIDIEENFPKHFDNDKSIENPIIAELEHELQATKEHLQTYVEELETSNEELQALNEELQSANEELQSTNEELETSNEELQSTNEELQIAYSELRTSNEALHEKEMSIMRAEANNNALLNNTSQISALIGNDLKLQAFNDNFKEFIKNLSGKEPKQNESFIRYYGENETREFLLDVKKVLDGEILQKEVKIGHDDKAKWFNTYYAPVYDKDKSIQNAVINLQDITARKKYLQEITSIKNQLDLAISGANLAWWDWDVKSGEVKYHPRKAEIIGYTLDEFPNNVYKIMELVHPDDYENAMQAMRDHLSGNMEIYECEYRIKTKSGDYKTFMDRGKIMERWEDGTPKRLTGIVFDITHNIILK
jgi:two-component system, chemotaxis family, CheB/CheR fusion protein